MTEFDQLHFDGKLLFMVYDSRSGSTVLSAALTDALPEVAVSPEFRIDHLLDIDPGVLRSITPAELVTRMSQGRLLANLQLDFNLLERVLAGTTRTLTHDRLLRIIVGMFLARQERGDAAVFIIKHGRHVRCWRGVVDLLPAAEFLHVFRDPRAVVSSNLSTERPYYPREKMAWGGPLLAAMRWRRYSREMRTAETSAQVLDVRYEDLVADTDAVMTAIAERLEVSVAVGLGATNSSYTIPEAERDIHALVSNDMDRSRAEAWRIELSEYARVVVESVAGREMALRGYVGSASPGTLRQVQALALSALEATGRSLVHFPYNWFTDRRNNRL